MSKLINITTITGTIVLKSGLHIGGGDASMKIGGIDNEVIKHPLTNEPYIPGSSIKGKVRSLLEWKLGLVGINEGKPANVTKHYPTDTEKENAIRIAQLFGNGGEIKENEEISKKVGVTRVSFNDCSLSEKIKTEVKFENSINRITSKADNPRQTERVPSGAKFDFEVNIKVFENDDNLVELLKEGLKLLELDSLGGNGSRGYGKIKFENLKENGEDIQEAFDTIAPFKQG
jgi:CRISPR-associated protein Csm3